MPTHLRIFLLSTVLLPALPALAEEPVLAEEPAEVATELAPVIIYATGLPTEVMLNPASISVIDGDDLPAIPVSIATLLRDVPGVQIGEEGIERVSIRGETARRVAILIDGQKLTDHTNYGQPIMVDPTTIDRIEVVRGSSSVVSGSRAIGGVINIITKRGADKPFSLTTQAGWFSATEGYRASASMAGTLDAGEGKLDYRLSVGRMDQGDRQTPDGPLVPSDTQDRNLSAHLGYRLGDHYFGLKAQSYDLAASVYTGDPDFVISLPHRDLRKISAFYEGTNLTPWLDRLTFDAYRQTIDREFTNDVTVEMAPGMAINVLSASEDEQDTAGLNLRAEMRLSENTRTLAGLEYEDDGLVADKDTITTMFGNATTTLRHDEAAIRTLSVFAQHEVAFTDALTGTFGGRWYDVSADHDVSSINGVAGEVDTNSDSLLLGSAGLVWSRGEGVALRANLSQGYIYPTLGQMFLTTTGGGVTLVGNPDLKPERSTTFELGARLDRAGAIVDATLFYTSAKDYIAAVYSGTVGTYENVDSARSWGLELYAEAETGVWGLVPHASVAAMRRQLEYGNGYRTFDSGTPGIAGTVGLRKDWQADLASGSLDLFLRGESGVEYRDENGAVVGSAGGFGTVNMRASLDFGQGASLVAELNNLTDRSYTSYGQLPGAERSINLFLTKTF